MKYINDTKISKIGLGTGRFGTRVSETLSFDMLDCFYENGGTLIDTACNGNGCADRYSDPCGGL